jgi:hypothetical protein
VNPKPYQRRRVVFAEGLFSRQETKEMAKYQFSDQLQMPALQELYQFATSGNAANKRDVLDAALVVLDYAGGLVFGEPSAVAGQSPARAGTPELARSALATQLKPLVEAKDEVGRKALAVPWMTIAMLVLQVIEQLLKQQGG